MYQKSKAGWAHIRRTYGITEEQFRELMQLSRGRCPVCRRRWTDNGGPCVDHNHSTREIRGLLCRFCNRYVIGRHRDPDLFLRGGRYLKSAATGWFVPVKTKRRKKTTRKRKAS